MVSVIVPNYNHGQFLKPRIDSILNQDFQDFELIILDDCSTDNSKEIIELYRNHLKVSRIEYNERNSGSPFLQWYKGIGYANGNLVWIAESDDLADSSFLSVLVKKLTEDRATMAYCQSLDIGIKGEKGGSRLYWTKELKPDIWDSDFCINSTEVLQYLKQKCFIPNVSACVFQKEAIKKVIDQSELNQFSRIGDWYCYFELAKRDNFLLAYSTQILNYFRETRTSSRYFSSVKEKQDRILEELKIINLNKKLFSATEWHTRIHALEMQWYIIHNKSNFNRRFFLFSDLTDNSKITLFYRFLKYKLVDRKRT